MKRTIVFSSACRISLKNCQLNVENQDSGELTRPLEISLSVTTASLARCLAMEEKELAYPQI